MDIMSATYTDKWGRLCFDVKVTGKDNSVMEKRISCEDYLKLFTLGVEKAKTFVMLPRLPKEVIWAATADRPESFVAVILLPEAKRPVFYAGQIIEEVPFPALCAYVKVDDGRRIKTLLYALKEASEDAELCKYPFGNVHGDGSCCFGNIVVDGIRDASEALKVTDAFLTGETNNDLYVAKGKFLSQGDLFESIRGKKSFPKGLLEPWKAGVTVRDLCKVE